MIQCKKIDSLGVVVNTTGKSQGTLIYVGINPKNEPINLIEQPLLKKAPIQANQQRIIQTQPPSKLNSRAISNIFASVEKSQAKTPKSQSKKIQILSNEKLQVANEMFKKKKKSSTKTKKKKSHTKSKSMAIKSEGQILSHHDPEREQYIQMLVGSSVEQFKKNLIKQKLEKQMERQRHSSMQEFMKFMDYEVRKANAERFVKRKSPSIGQLLPWGIDQQKLRDYWNKMLQIHSRMQTSKSPHQVEKDDKERRQNIGLGFLNSYSESFIKDVVKKQKDDFVRKTSPEKITERIKTKPKTPSCDEIQLKSYMLQKQAEWKQKTEQEKIFSKLKQQRVKANLQLLESEIEIQKKRIFSQNSCRHNSSIKCKSTGVPNSRKFSQPLIEPQNQNQLYTQEQQQQLINLEFEYLQQEQAKLINWRQSPRSQIKKKIPLKVHSHMRQISTPSTGNGLLTPQTQNQDFIAWLQQLPESFLEQQLFQMQVINQQMNAQGFNYILSENEQYQFLEEFLKEKFKQHQKTLLISKSVPNLSGVQSFPHSQLQSVTESRKLSQKHSDNSPHKGLRERHKKLAERWNKTPMAQQNRAAITIQKYWRGFRIRQMVFQYLQTILNQEEQKLIPEQIPEESSQRKTPLVATQSDKFSFQPLSQMGSLLGSQVTQQLPSPVLSQTSEVIDSVIHTPLKKNDFDDHLVPFSDPMFGVDELGSSKNSHGSSPSQMLIRSVLGVPKNLTSGNKQHGASSGSLITIQELHTEIQQRKQIKTPEKREGKISQTAMWEQLLKELNEFKQSEKHLSRRAMNFINNLQKQSETNLKLVEQQEQQQIIKIEKPIEKVDEMAQTEIPLLIDNEEQTSQQITILSQHDSANKEHHHTILDPDFQCNIYQLISQREHLIEQKYQEQLRIMELMLDQKKVSLEQFQRNKDRLDRKNQIDKENLGENKNELERMRRLFEDTIKLTQKDIQFIEKMKKQSSDHDESLRQIFSLRSDSEQSDSDIRYSKGRISEEPADDLLLSIEDIIQKQDIVDQKLDLVTQLILQEQIEQFAVELNQFPLQSLGVLMEWDEESDIEIKNKFLPGFPTTLNFVKDYLIAFSDFIEKNFLKSFISQINTPLGISPTDLLKTISLSDPQAINNDESTTGPLYPLIKHIHMMEPVIDEEIWDRFNQQYSVNLKYISMNEPDYTQVKECEIFHLRMIYDAFNEALNCIRPFGLRGQPYPWRCNPQKVYQNQTQPKNIEKAMGFGIAKMLKWGAFLCGFIPEKIETPQGEVILIEEDYLNQIKEDRLQQMLENEIHENEEKWLNYEEELTEVCVEMADIVFESMLDEASEELFSILQREKFIKK